jgi:hypothetical protein
MKNVVLKFASKMNCLKEQLKEIFTRFAYLKKLINKFELDKLFKMDKPTDKTTDSKQEMQMLTPSCFIAYCADDEKAEILTQYDLQKTVESKKT